MWAVHSKSSRIPSLDPIIKRMHNWTQLFSIFRDRIFMRLWYFTRLSPLNQVKLNQFTKPARYRGWRCINSIFDFREAHRLVFLIKNHQNVQRFWLRQLLKKRINPPVNRVAVRIRLSAHSRQSEQDVLYPKVTVLIPRWNSEQGKDFKHHPV